MLIVQLTLMKGMFQTTRVIQKAILKSSLILLRMKMMKTSFILST